MSNTAADLESAKNSLIVQSIASHKNTTTTNPPQTDRQPKNAIDQRLLSVNCKRNILKALFTPGVLSPFRQTKNAAIPISVNKLTHTGAKTQFGGLKVGLLINVYHSIIERRVKNDPIMPAP